jgi:hypothetical protein
MSEIVVAKSPLHLLTEVVIAFNAGFWFDGNQQYERHNLRNEILVKVAATSSRLWSSSGFVQVYAGVSRCGALPVTSLPQGAS